MDDDTLFENINDMLDEQCEGDVPLTMEELRKAAEHGFSGAQAVRDKRIATRGAE